MISRKLLQSATSSVLLAGLIIPSMASAAVTVTTGVKVDVRANVCVAIGTHLTDIEVKLADLQAKIDSKRDQRESEINSERMDRQKKIKNIESTAEQNRLYADADLKAAATTDLQKAAVSRFQSDVRLAVTTRMDAFQKANDTFNEGIDAAVANRKAAVATAVSAFHNSIKAALDKAKADCAAGVSMTTIRAAFTASVKAARTKLEMDRHAIDGIGAQARVLAQTRKSAHAAAMADFHASMESARADLKAAFAAEVRT